MLGVGRRGLHLGRREFSRREFTVSVPRFDGKCVLVCDSISLCVPRLSAPRAFILVTCAIAFFGHCFHVWHAHAHVRTRACVATM